MDRYLLKNIIIIILILVNGFLLGSLVMRQTSERSVRRQTEAHLTELFRADGIELEEGVISHQTPPAPCSLTQDREQLKKAAAFFLGDNLLQDNQNGIYSCTGDAGVARFRSGGSFEIEGKLADSNAEDLCKAFCEAFSLDSLVFVLDETGTGVGTAVCLHEKLPVFNCTVTFTLNRGTLNRVSGTLLPENETTLSASREPFSSIAALTAFQKTRRESGAVVSAVSDMYLCYELESSSTTELILTPSWCIVTDTSKYYVNSSSGIVSSG